MTAEQIIADFRRMLAEKWGYIPATSGEMWTAEKQQKAAAKSETVARYGSRWIGYHVADCSGAFVWAYRQHGMSIYHGSNRIAREYLTERGAALLPMSEAKPGMAAFKLRKPGDKNYALPSEYKPGGEHYNGDLNDYYHIGLVDADGSIINAQSTAKGVQRSKASGWSCAGYLRAVEYEKNDQNERKDEAPMQNAIVTADGQVNLRKGPSKKDPLVNKLSPGTEVQIVQTVTNEGKEWAAVKSKKGSGYIMTEYLTLTEATQEPDEPEAPTGTTEEVEKKLYQLMDCLEKAQTLADDLQRLLTGAAG